MLHRLIAAHRRILATLCKKLQSDRLKHPADIKWRKALTPLSLVKASFLAVGAASRTSWNRVRNSSKMTEREPGATGLQVVGREKL